MAIWTYPRSLRNGRTNDGGGQKNSVKDEFLAQKNSSNQQSFRPKYPHCVPQSIQEMGHFAGYLWAYWGRGHSDAPIRVGNTHGLADRSLVSTTGHHPHPTPSATHPPVSSPPVLLSSGDGGSWSGPTGLTLSPRVPCAPSPCLPVLLVVERWVCVPRGLGGPERGCVCPEGQKTRKRGGAEQAICSQTAVQPF